MISDVLSVVQVHPVRLDLLAHPVPQAEWDLLVCRVHQASVRLALQGRLELLVFKANPASKAPLVRLEFLVLLDHRDSDFQVCAPILFTYSTVALLLPISAVVSGVV